jgi:cytochrome c oxidase cbb3-type subunit 3
MGMADEQSLIKSSEVYTQKCALCHGKFGFGDGLITSSIDNYPVSDLLKRRFSKGFESTVSIIKYGGTKGTMSSFSPPWIDELTEQEIADLVRFIALFSNDPVLAKRLLLVTDNASEHLIEKGKLLFLSRCTVCHGKSGKGDGRLSGILIKNPKPFNLTKSTRNIEYLQKIIYFGSKPLGRSSNMPSWAAQFNDIEIKNIAMYLMTIRE